MSKMKNYLLQSYDGYDYYNVTAENLDDAIKKLHESELNDGEDFETVKEWFHDNFIVFESDTEIKVLIP